MADIPLGITSYKSDSLPISAQRCINAYAELQPKSAKEAVSVFGSPGLAIFAEIGTGPIRGGFVMGGVSYFVSGSDFYSVDALGSGTLLGSGITGSGPVSIDGSGIEIVMVNGTTGFSYLPATNDFAQITDGDFQPANTVAFINSLFVFDWKGTNKFFVSDVLDGRSYDSLMFGSAESKPDNVIAVRNANGVLLLLGEKTTESWDHTGASSLPFQRFKGGTIDHGIAAPHAICDEDSARFFLGNDLIFYRLDGLSARRVSTHAIEKEWATYSKTDDAFCFPVSYGGHKFIHVTFPTAGKTWAFDIASKYLWHERMSWDATGREVKWRGACCVTAYNKTLIGDANSGRIGYLDPSTYTEFGDPIVTSMVLPPVHAKGSRMAMPGFELDMETGVGLVTGQGSDPQVILDWSDDGGHTFSSPQMWSSAGRVGEYHTRLSWLRLGAFYSRSLRVSISDPVKRVFLAARLNPEPEVWD